MSLMDRIKKKAKQSNKHILLPEGTEERNQRATSIAVKEGLAKVTLLGAMDEILALAKERHINLAGVDIVDPIKDDRLDDYAMKYYKLREKKGLSYGEALVIMQTPMYFATMMIEEGIADGLVAGAVHATGDVLRPGLQIIKTLPAVSTASSCFIMSLNNKEFGSDGLILFADCAVIPNPTAEQMAEIAVSTAATAKALCDIEPYVALLSFSTKGSASHEMVDKVAKATELARKLAPDIAIDGEIQADAALVSDVGRLKCLGSPVAGRANVLIFPDLQSANISYKLVQRLAGAEAIGPISQGFRKPFNDLSRGCSANDIVNLIAITAVQAEEGC